MEARAPVVMWAVSPGPWGRSGTVSVQVVPHRTHRVGTGRTRRVLRGVRSWEGCHRSLGHPERVSGCLGPAVTVCDSPLPVCPTSLGPWVGRHPSCSRETHPSGGPAGSPCGGPGGGGGGRCRGFRTPAGPCLSSPGALGHPQRPGSDQMTHCHQQTETRPAPRASGGWRLMHPANRTLSKGQQLASGSPVGRCRLGTCWDKTQPRPLCPKACGRAGPRPRDTGGKWAKMGFQGCCGG